MWNQLGWFNWFWQFLCEVLSSYNPKEFCYSYAWSCSLYEGGISFLQDLSPESSENSYLCFWLTLLYSEPYFFFLSASPSSSLCTVFGAISSTIDEAVSIKRSANVFVHVDFNVHHKDWLIWLSQTTLLGWSTFLFGSVWLSQSCSIGFIYFLRP